jgi:hypothetical protein
VIREAGNDPNPKLIDQPVLLGSWEAMVMAKVPSYLAEVCWLQLCEE